MKFVSTNEKYLMLSYFDKNIVFLLVKIHIY